MFRTATGPIRCHPSAEAPRRGCSDDPYDCDAGLSNWHVEWSEGKKFWCCEHRSKGCEAASSPYDCSSGYSSWQSTWTPGKKTWCCEKQHRLDTSKEDAWRTKELLSFFEEGWSTAKKAWCCQHFQRGCGSGSSSYDCKAGLSNWRVGWSADKKSWCCTHAGTGCISHQHHVVYMHVPSHEVYAGHPLPWRAGHDYTTVPVPVPPAPRVVERVVPERLPAPLRAVSPMVARVAPVAPSSPTDAQALKPPKKKKKLKTGEIEDRRSDDVDPFASSSRRLSRATRDTAGGGKPRRRRSTLRPVRTEGLATLTGEAWPPMVPREEKGVQGAYVRQNQHAMWSACAVCGLRTNYQPKKDSKGETRHMGPHPRLVALAMEQIRASTSTSACTEHLVNGKIMELKGLELQRGLTQTQAINMTIKEYRKRMGYPPECEERPKSPASRSASATREPTSPKKKDPVAQTELLMVAASEYLLEQTGMDSLDPAEFKKKVLEHIQGRKIKEEERPKDHHLFGPEAVDIFSSEEEKEPVKNKKKESMGPEDLERLVEELLPTLNTKRRLLRDRLRPRRIILVRHGESVGNRDKTAYQHTPDSKIELTPLGELQGAAAGQQIRTLVGNGTVRFFYSPYMRTRQTLQEILKAFKGQQIEMCAEPRLREQDFGNFQEWTGSWRRKFGRFYYRFPNGEAGTDVFDRVSDFWSSLLRSMDTSPVENLVLVTHGLLMRIFCMVYFHWTVEDFREIRFGEKRNQPLWNHMKSRRGPRVLTPGDESILDDPMHQSWARDNACWALHGRIDEQTRWKSPVMKSRRQV
eukprot:g29395.t1